MRVRQYEPWCADLTHGEKASRSSFEGTEEMSADVEEEFKREILGVMHPGHKATMELDPDYFAALKNYYSTWTISRKDAVIPRAVMEFIIVGILLTQGKMHGAKVHIRRALMAGATPREVFEAVTVAAIPGGVPVVWHGAAMVKDEMEKLQLGYEQRYAGSGPDRTEGEAGGD
jgi:alkylhydroperoxidase/carboxymuconolactone decarboxylase family protein YurZ